MLYFEREREREIGDRRVLLFFFLFPFILSFIFYFSNFMILATKKKGEREKKIRKMKTKTNSFLWDRNN
jgi:hypothetical protein